ALLARNSPYTARTPPSRARHRGGYFHAQFHRCKERSTVSIYYQDDHVTLYHGDSLEILPTLDVQADALLTDPPYFKVKNEDWDRQWAKPDEFLRWIGSFLDAAKPLLAPH